MIDDYFEKPKVESAAERSAKLRAKMEQTNTEMQEIAKKIEKIAPQIEYDPIVLG